MTAILWTTAADRLEHQSDFHNIPCTWKPSVESLRTLQVSRAQKMLGDEFGTASNIKNRVNRQSVLGAITSAQQRLKLYNKVSGSRINAEQSSCSSSFP